MLQASRPGVDDGASASAGGTHVLASRRAATAEGSRTGVLAARRARVIAAAQGAPGRALRCGDDSGSSSSEDAGAGSFRCGGSSRSEDVGAAGAGAGAVVDAGTACL